MPIADGQLLVGEASSNSFKLATLTEGAGVTITNGPGSITIDAVGGNTVVTSTATGTQNDFAPGLLGQTVLRMNNASAATITGFAGGIDGQLLTIISVGTGLVFLSHEDGGSSASNRLVNVATSAYTPLSAGFGSATYVYDATSSRWRLVAHEQGQPMADPFNAGDYTAAGSMTWTVQQSDVSNRHYFLQGRVLTVCLVIFDSSIGGTPDVALYSKVPGGFIGGPASLSLCHIANNGVEGIGQAKTNITNIEFRRVPLTNWSTSNNNAFVGVTISFAVT